MLLACLLAACSQVHLKQPEIMAKINKLVAAGIIQVK
jgi:hypothetical protein